MSGEKARYVAEIVDIQDITYSYGTDDFHASTDDDAKIQARERAQAECKTRRIDKKVALILTGGTIYGSHREVINPHD